MSRYGNFKNIVLIGMSGVGKTVVGEYIANKLSMEFLDTDEMIITSSRKTIDYIFNIYGEEYFRSLERDVIKSLSSKRGVVISTGGGVVLYNQNIQILKENGIIFLLKASIETIVSNLETSLSYKEKRPLLKDSLCFSQRIEEIYNDREKLYVLSADHIINVDDKTVGKVGDEIIHIFQQLNPCSCFWWLI